MLIDVEGNLPSYETVEVMQGQISQHDYLINCVDIQEHHTNEFEIFPNPVSTYETLTISLSISEHQITIQLFSISGDLVYKTKINNTSSEQLFQFQLPEVSAGVYYCQFKSDSVSVSKKLVIK